jgi:hypothetical protein
LMQTRISWIAPSEDRPGADRPMIRDVLDPRNVAPCRFLDAGLDYACGS